MLINVLRDEKPTHLGVAFDVSRHTFRSEIYSEYKANRTTTPDEFRGQLDLVKEVLKAPQHPLRGEGRVRGRRCDRHPATRAEAAGFDVLICTGDRDIFQLVSDSRDRVVPAQRRLRSRAYDAQGGGGAVLCDARALPRACRPGRRVQRQSARCSRRRTQDSGQVAGDVRRSGKPAAHAGELKGKAAEAFQERINDSCATGR